MTQRLTFASDLQESVGVYQQRTERHSRERGDSAEVRALECSQDKASSIWLQNGGEWQEIRPESWRGAKLEGSKTKEWTLLSGCSLWTFKEHSLLWAMQSDLWFRRMFLKVWSQDWQCQHPLEIVRNANS